MSISTWDFSGSESEMLQGLADLVGLSYLLIKRLGYDFRGLTVITAALGDLEKITIWLILKPSGGISVYCLVILLRKIRLRREAMYISDKKMLDYFSIILILCLPWLCTAWSMWGWIWEVIIILAVLWTGIHRGLKWASVLLIAGYSLAALSFGLPGLAHGVLFLGPGLWGIAGLNKGWPQRVTVFWSLVAAGFLGAAPTLWFEGFNAQIRVFLIP